MLVWADRAAHDYHALAMFEVTIRDDIDATDYIVHELTEAQYRQTIGLARQDLKMAGRFLHQLFFYGPMKI